MRSPLRLLLLSLACSVALSAQAQDTSSQRLDIPAGSLSGALDALSQQSGTQVVYPADQLRGVSTAGVQGTLTQDQALGRLLQGSGFSAKRGSTGAVVIVRDAAPAPQASPSPAAAPRANGPAAAPAAPVQSDPTTLEALQVTGSRIPRAQIEGPAPITVITADDIRAGGFTSVPDVLQSLTQNSGETQSEQSAGGADFSPGAQQVDLRALGPNHTLVLVNGRRIADFPMPFGGRSNFTDISGLPLGMIERIEVLTGSASAIYGSDAISGVVNVILKKEADGTTLDYRYGVTGEGDGVSHRFNLSTGFSQGNFSLVGGLEYLKQDPLWGYQRERQDSSNDAPNPTRNGFPSRNFLITDFDDDYIDPGEATCSALSGLNEGTMQYAFRRRFGNYCGSDRSVAYRTMTSEREGVNLVASMGYDLDNGMRWFADVQAGRHEVSLFRATRSWSLMTPDGTEWDYFFNQNTDQLEYWQRQFTVEEMGGLGTGMVNTLQKTFGITTGFTGTLGSDWDYEAALGHSQYRAEISWPQIVASLANNLFLGPLLGYDADGYPIYNAPHSRMYTPLTRAEYDSIFARTTYFPESETQTLSFTLTNASLFELAGGAAGFAATAELGHQSYDLKPDPLATQFYYYSWKDSDGEGSRNRWALASELRMPVLETVNVSVAGRFDQYRFAGRDPNKFTWSAGLEWRPLDDLLMRGSYGTAFRAPDLHYVFTGPGNDETSVTDFYRCDTEEPGEDYDDCSYGDEGIIRSRVGNRDLEPETSNSWTAGMVWSPTLWMDVSLDYFSIDMSNQVQDLRANEVMRLERDCRLGINGADLSSALCTSTLARVTRTQTGAIANVFVNPINIANETTSGVDLSTHLRMETRIGTFGLAGGYTWVRQHDIQEYEGEAIVDMFAVNSGYGIPRSKASLRASWENGGWNAALQGRRLGSLPNGWSYDEIWEEGDPGPTISATYRYNATFGYRLTERSQLTLSVVNLLDSGPPFDPTYTSYPYYDISWFDTEGRSFYLQYTHKFGGAAL